MDQAPTDSSEERRDSEVLKELMRVRNELAYYISAGIPNRADSEDVFQEVCLKVWDKRQEYQPGTNFRAWAFTIARFTIMDWRKRYATRRLQFLDAETIEILLAETADEIIASKNISSHKEALNACIKQLDARSEQLIGLFYLKELPLADLALREGTSVAAMKQTLYRIRNKLRKCIERRLKTSSLSS